MSIRGQKGGIKDESGSEDRCDLVVCGCFLIMVSDFLVKAEAGSSAKSEDGEKMLEV